MFLLPSTVKSLRLTLYSLLPTVPYATVDSTVYSQRFSLQFSIYGLLYVQGPYATVLYPTVDSTVFYSILHYSIMSLLLPIDLLIL